MKFLVLTISLLILENVQCFYSTYCPKVDPMPGFKWEPVFIKKKFFLNFFSHKFLVFRELAPLHRKWGLCYRRWHMFQK